MKWLNEIKNINNIPGIMFGILILNYLPLFILNMFSKESKAVPMVIMAVFFFIEIIVLSLYYYFNKDNIKVNKRNCFLLIVNTVIMILVQIRNIIINDFYYMDMLNIGCIFVNIFLFYILIFDIKIKESKLEVFYIGMIIVGIIATLWNLFLFHNELLAKFGFKSLSNEYSFIYNIKGFFANRNTFAFFLYIAIVSNFLLLKREMSKKKRNVCISTIVILMFGILCTGSKTGYAISVMFIELMILLKNDVSIMKRIVTCIIVGVICGVGLLEILGINVIKKSIDKIEKIIPISVNKIENEENYTQLNDEGKKAEENNNVEIYENKVISKEQIAEFSGRTGIWKKAVEKLNASPLNYIFGVGRFNSTNILKIKTKTFTQFHNVYIDLVLTGGVIFLIYIFSIYFFVYKKVIQSDLKKIYKIIYIIAFGFYCVYMMLESVGRFSIGCVDTSCIIFFITLPLLHANSIKNE